MFYDKEVFFNYPDSLYSKEYKDPEEVFGRSYIEFNGSYYDGKKESLGNFFSKVVRRFYGGGNPEDTWIPINHVFFIESVFCRDLSIRYCPETNQVCFLIDSVRGIFTRMKLGRFVKKVCPVLTDIQIENIVSVFKSCFIKKEYTLHSSKDPADFATVYMAKAASYTGNFDYACINSSCMRGDFKLSCRNPAYVYGSGDWEIFWIEEAESNKVSARCIVAPEIKKWVRIYASDQMSGMYLEEQLKNLGYSGYEYSSDFCGLKILKIEESGSLVGPYFDFELGLEEDGDFLVFCKNGPITGTNQNGFLDNAPVTCYECGDEVDDDGIYIYGDVYCSCCVNYCEYYDEYVTGSVNEVVTGFTSQGRKSYSYWSERAIEDHAGFVDGDYWSLELLLEDKDGELITPEQVYEGDYIYVEEEDTYYHVDDYEEMMKEEEEEDV